MGLTKTVYLLLGSNLGNRRANLARALEALAEAGVRVIRRASLYATEPVDFEVQNWFLNTVVEAETELMPRQLLRVVQGIERRMGRRRMVRGGPRVVDIDILLYGTSVVHSPELTIPHPKLAERRFVLAPLRELAPALRHPAQGRTIAEMLAASSDRSLVRKLRS